MDKIALAQICRKVAAEGCVLLKNNGDLLPLKAKSRIAVFGRIQTTYYKSGTGSGGRVHLEKQPCILESLRDNEDLIIDEKLVSVYTEWEKENPFNDGGGVWAGEPWFQQEMPVSEQLAAEAAERNDVAVIIIGRTAGEDHDNAAESGSYYLTENEEQLICVVTQHFKKVIVALNVGNIIDVSFVDKYAVDSLLYIWQGGMEGANAFADLLSGKSYPCGKLTDTMAFSVDDYPSSENFGGEKRNIYAEDIYVGYRYFETFMPDRVRFPFGYGLSYTDFKVSACVYEKDDFITVCADVENIGKHPGKQVIQVYFKAPCGDLGTPSKQLVAYVKTDELAPGESRNVKTVFSVSKMASYDDIGVTGHKGCYVLQQGEYEIFVGTDVRSNTSLYKYVCRQTTVCEELETAMPPLVGFKRLCACEENGIRTPVLQEIAPQEIQLEERIAQRRPEELAYTGDKGIKLKDVYEEKYSLEEFVAQLADSELAALVCGEGMGSPKATPGTGGALGGQTETLSSFGIPVCCVTDGPSGIRIDTGKKASLIPNGTLLASTWDDDLVEQIYTFIGEELKYYSIDALLGPGINIHRSPLCGRNFEYFSEDPLLTGKIAAAVTRGIGKAGSFSTVKHFCCNNQEKKRAVCESLVSERALREIYLKGFEIAVKEGENVLIMTSYNPINGYWAASNYDLNTTLLRNEWGFENLVMTDWWATGNLTAYGVSSKENVQSMVRAQNDVFMVCPDAATKSHSVLEGLNDGYITRGELQRCVMNICGWIIRTNTFKEYLENGCIPKYPIAHYSENMKQIAKFEDIKVETEYEIELEKGRSVLFEFEVSCNTDVLAQNTVSVKLDGASFVFSVCGTGGKTVIVKRSLPIRIEGLHKLSLTHKDVVKIHRITVKQ